jgi:hypothetical protein
MPRTFTLGTLVSRCQQQADLEGHGGFSTTEWKQWISTQYAELYSIIAESGLRYFETVETITTDGTADYAEPAAHLSTVGVDWVVSASTGERRALFELMHQERNAFTGQTGGNAVAFQHIDDTMYLYPTPPSGQTYEWRYIAQPTDYSASADNTTIDIVTPDGEGFIIWGVVARALAKEGSDTRDARFEREAARERVQNWATLKMLSNPRRRIVDEESLVADPADFWSRG